MIRLIILIFVLCGSNVRASPSANYGSMSESYGGSAQTARSTTATTAAAPPPSGGGSKELVTGYEYSNVTGHCYKLHTEEVIWSVANETCHEEGGLLAVVNSREEALLLGVIGEGTEYACFVGVYKDSADHWVTSTGEDVVVAAGHHVWSAREPWHAKQMVCGLIYDDGTIGTASMDADYPFICERAA